MTRERIRYYWERYVYNVGARGVWAITDAYKCPSSAKVSAWTIIKNQCEQRKGFKMSVITHSCHFFTVGYMFKDNDNLMFRVETPTDCGEMVIGQDEKWYAIQHGVLN